ncbi:MAG: YaiO family outer membrane beta-barrel protein [Cellulophaga sp.]|nr:YaiO family outer membrane beta-barrel protein [Cellulophaga sp.]
MYLKKLFLLVCFGCVLCATRAQTIEYSGNPDASFFAARDLAFSGDRTTARDTLKQILSKYPEYADVRNLLAKTYSWDGEYLEARNHFNKIISKEKKLKEVWVAAINNEMYAEEYYLALGLANKALKYLENDEDLLALEEKAQLALTIDKTVEEVIFLDAEAGDVQKNSILFTSSVDVFDVVFDPMTYASIAYSTKTKYGTIIPRLNYSNRFNINGMQLEVDAYPKFSKKVYAYLNYGYSDSPIFPAHRAGAELYTNLPNAMEASLGVRYLNFGTSRVFIFTGSYGLYAGNYFFSLRPYVTPSENNTLNISGNILARKYLKDKYNFIGVNASFGYTSELKQFIADNVLLAESLLFLESQNILIEYQFLLNNNKNGLGLTLGVTRQELSFRPGDFFIAGTLGLNYQFKF